MIPTLQRAPSSTPPTNSGRRKSGALADADNVAAFVDASGNAIPAAWHFPKVDRNPVLPEDAVQLSRRRAAPADHLSPIVDPGCKRSGSAGQHSEIDDCPALPQERVAHAPNVHLPDDLPTIVDGIGNAVGCTWQRAQKGDAPARPDECLEVPCGGYGAAYDLVAIVDTNNESHRP